MRHTIGIFMEVLADVVDKYEFEAFVHPVVPVLNETRHLVTQYNQLFRQRVDRSPICTCVPSTPVSLSSLVRRVLTLASMGLSPGGWTSSTTSSRARHRRFVLSIRCLCMLLAMELTVRPRCCLHSFAEGSHLMARTCIRRTLACSPPSSPRTGRV
jgi:hypothetical protein